MRFTAEEQKGHRDLWSRALRSGDYDQNEGSLRSSDGTKFCCLGVAVDVSGLKAWDANLSEASCLPETVKEWLGLTHVEGEYDDVYDDVEGGKHYLTIDNDGWFEHDAKSFTEIADIIESEPKGLIANA